MKPLILLVEDNPDDVELTLRALKAHAGPLEVEVARGGQEALERLVGTRRLDRMPAVVLLDLKLPGLDGLGFLRRVRSQPATAHLPVVVLTSSREERDVDACYQLGANSYVQKPIDSVAFAEAVRALGRYWLDLNILPCR
jgi:two-component system response regulator